MLGVGHLEPAADLIEGPAAALAQVVTLTCGADGNARAAGSHGTPRVFRTGVKNARPGSQPLVTIRW